GFPPPGQILPPFVQDQLKLTPEQKKEMEALQKEVDARLDKMMTEEQRKQFKAMRERPPGSMGGPPGGAPGGGVVIRGPGPGGMFRSYRYPADYAGLAGKDLKPGKKLEEVVNEKK